MADAAVAVGPRCRTAGRSPPPSMRSEIMIGWAHDRLPAVAHADECADHRRHHRQRGAACTLLRRTFWTLR